MRSRYCYFLKVTCYVILLHFGKCNLLKLQLLKKVTCYCNGVLTSYYQTLYPVQYPSVPYFISELELPQ